MTHFQLEQSKPRHLGFFFKEPSTSEGRGEGGGGGLQLGQ
jgi:hypothetical protein